MSRDMRSKKETRRREELRKRRRRKEEALSLLKDVVVAAVIVGIVMAGLYIYTGFIWPPMVVVESGSMMHGKDSSLGVIDTGDLTLVKRVDSRNDIITYIEANPDYNTTSRAHKGYKQYGDFGDVIIYEKNGKKRTPVIHRAIIWVVYNDSLGQPCADIPDLGVFCVRQFTLKDITYRHYDLPIDFNVIFSRDYARHDGFLTHGDNNQAVVDQVSLPVDPTSGEVVSPVQVNWIVGKAEGELPWFGLLKLLASGAIKSDDVPPSSMKGLVVSIVLIIAIPLAIDIGLYFHGKTKKMRKGRSKAKKPKGKRGNGDEGEDEDGLSNEGEGGKEGRKKKDEEEKEEEEDEEEEDEEEGDGDVDGEGPTFHKRKRGSKAKALEDKEGTSFDVEDELDKDY